MPTHREQSFLATLWLGTRPVNTLDVLHGKPAWVNWLGPAVTTPYIVGTVRNDSAMLSCQPGITTAAMLFYFRHTEQGYQLYVREPGPHFGKAVALKDNVYLNVRPTKEYTPGVFAVLNPNGEVARFSDVTADIKLVALACNGAAVSRSRRVNSTYEYLAAKNQRAQVWLMKIVERNVPWFSSPDEA